MIYLQAPWINDPDYDDYGHCSRYDDEYEDEEEEDEDDD